MTEMRKGTAKRDATFSDGHWSASITRVTRTYDGARKYAKVKIEESTSPKIQRPDTGFDRPVAKHMSPAAFVIAIEDYARKPQCDCIRVESEQMRTSNGQQHTLKTNGTTFSISELLESDESNDSKMCLGTGKSNIALHIV